MVMSGVGLRSEVGPKAPMVLGQNSLRLCTRHTSNTLWKPTVFTCRSHGSHMTNRSHGSHMTNRSHGSHMTNRSHGSHMFTGHMGVACPQVTWELHDHRHRGHMTNKSHDSHMISTHIHSLVHCLARGKYLKCLHHILLCSS